MTQVGFVYKLCCIDPEIKEIYVGSTKNLRVRKNQHKTNCNNANSDKHHFKVYQFIRANGGFSNFDIIQLERFEFNTKYELHARERHYIESLKASLNRFIPTRSTKEYHEENKENIKEYKKLYNEEHKENQKKYWEENKEKMKEQAKQYREQNKEKIKEYRKRYYEEHKIKNNQNNSS